MSPYERTRPEITRYLSNQSTYIMAVAELHTSEYLPQNFSDGHFAESVRIFLEIIKDGVVDEFKNEIKTFPSSKYFN